MKNETWTLSQRVEAVRMQLPHRTGPDEDIFDRIAIRIAGLEEESEHAQENLTALDEAHGNLLTRLHRIEEAARGFAEGRWDREAFLHALEQKGEQ